MKYRMSRWGAALMAGLLMVGAGCASSEDEQGEGSAVAAPTSTAPVDPVAVSFAGLGLGALCSGGFDNADDKADAIHAARKRAGDDEDVAVQAALSAAADAALEDCGGFLSDVEWVKDAAKSARERLTDGMSSDEVAAIGVGAYLGDSLCAFGADDAANAVRDATGDDDEGFFAAASHVFEECGGSEQLSFLYDDGWIVGAAASAFESAELS